MEQPLRAALKEWGFSLIQSEMLTNEELLSSGHNYLLHLQASKSLNFISGVERERERERERGREGEGEGKRERERERERERGREGGRKGGGMKINMV